MGFIVGVHLTPVLFYDIHRYVSLSLCNDLSFRKQSNDDCFIIFRWLVTTQSTVVFLCLWILSVSSKSKVSAKLLILIFKWLEWERPNLPPDVFLTFSFRPTLSYIRLEREYPLRRYVSTGYVRVEVSIVLCRRNPFIEITTGLSPYGHIRPPQRDGEKVCTGHSKNFILPYHVPVLFLTKEVS